MEQPQVTADAHDPPVLDGDVQPVAVRVQYRGRRHPAVDVLGRHTLLEEPVLAHGPALAAAVRRSLTPGVGDTVYGHLLSNKVSVKPVVLAGDASWATADPADGGPGLYRVANKLRLRKNGTSSSPKPAWATTSNH